MTDKKNAVSSAAKLTQEEEQILLLTRLHRISANNLEAMFNHIGDTEIEDFVSDMDELMLLLLSSVSELNDTEVIALHRLYSFTRELDVINHHR